MLYVFIYQGLSFKDFEKYKWFWYGLLKMPLIWCLILLNEEIYSQAGGQ